MNCVKCGKCCTNCKIVKDRLFVDHARDLIVLAESCADLQEFRQALKKMIDQAIEKNARREYNEQLRTGL